MTDLDDLVQALDKAVEDIMAQGRTAILFSGGLDSGLLAALAKRHGKPRLYTVGVEGCPDLTAGQKAAEEMALPWTGMTITPAEVLAASHELLNMCPIDSPVVLSFELPLHMIASRVDETILMSGQGADELFGGYGRYLKMSPSDLEVEMTGDLDKLLADIAPLDHHIAMHSSKTIGHPYLDPLVRDVAARIPVMDKRRDGMRKVPLRTIAAGLGLDFLATREKQAAQYGSGIMKVLKAQARRDRMDLSEYMSFLRSRPAT